MKPPANTPIAITEVFPRDGLQALVPDEWERLDTAWKVELCTRLAACGIDEIEATSFAHPRRIPQLGDAEAVTRALGEVLGARGRALVPNMRGLQRAFAADVRKVALFLVASETYQRKNVGMDVETALVEIAAMKRELDRHDGVAACAALGTAFVCPYEGVVRPERVRAIVDELAALGFREICLADTAGTAEPRRLHDLCAEIVARHPGVEFALHLHDRHGRALVNVSAGIQAGIRRLETSILGIGAGIAVPGDPRGMGNVATPEVVELLRGLELATTVDEARLRETLAWTRAGVFGDEVESVQGSSCVRG